MSLNKYLGGEKMKKGLGLALVLVMILSLMACTTAGEKETGNELKIVSFAPSNTEIIAAVGGIDNLVGVSDFCNYPNEVLEIDKVGDAWQANFEKIVALQPDYVFMMSEGETYDRLIELGIEVKIVNPQSIEEIYTSITEIAQLLNNEEKGQELIENMKMELADIESQFLKEKPSVFMLIDSKTFWTVGDNTFANEVIEKSGGINSAAIESGWFEISQEKLLELDPDIILYSWPPEDEITTLPAWQNLSAVKEGRVYQIDGDLTSRPSNRIVEGVKLISNIIKKGE